MSAIGRAVLWVRATTRRGVGGLVLIAVLAGSTGACVLIALVGAARTRSALDRAIVATDPSVLTLQSSDPAAFVGLEALPGVRRVLPFSTFVGSVGDRDVLLYEAPQPFSTDLDRIEPSRGRFPDAADEVMLTPQTASAMHVRLGDTLMFDGQSRSELVSGDPPVGPVVSLRVVGIGSTLIQRVQTDDAAGWVCEQFATMYDEEIGHLGGASGLLNVVFVWVDGGTRGIAAVRGAIAAKDPAVGVGAFSTFAEPARSSTDTMADGVLVFAVAAAIAGCGATFVAVTRRLGRSQQDRSLLVSLGMSSRDRSMLSAASLAPAAVAGAAIAVVVCEIAAPVMPFGAVARRLDPHVGARPGVLLLGAVAVLTIGFVIGAAFIASHTASSRSTTHRPGVVARWMSSPFASSPTVSAGVRFTVETRHGARGPTRSALLAGAFGVAGVVGGMSVTRAISELSSEPSRWGFTWSVSVNEGDLGSDVAADDARMLLADRDVGTAVAGWAISSDAQAEINGTEVRADVLDVRAGAIAPAIQRGRAPNSPNEVVLSASTAERMHVAIGEVVTATTDAGTVALTVVGEATLYPYESGLLRAMAVLMTEEGRDAVARGRTTYRIAFAANPNVSRDDLYDRLHTVIGDDMPARVDALPAAPSEVRSTLQLRGVARAVAAFTGLVGLVTVANSVLGLSRRRRTDFAILQAIGARPSQISQIFAVFAVTTAALTLAIGVPMGMIVGRTVSAAIIRHAGAHPDASLAGAGTAGVAAAMIAITLLFSALPSTSVRRTRPASGLRSE